MNIKNKHNNKGFSFVELIVAGTILIILSTLGFFAYSQYLVDARDSQRSSDFASIISSMKVYKQKRGSLPQPGDKYGLYTASGTVAYQGYLNNLVKIDTLEKIPTDPYINTPYSYSITSNRQEMQIAGSLENGGRSIAILDGTYKSVSKNVLPTIIIAATLSTDTDITTTQNKNKFIFNKNTHNLPYSFEDGSPYSDGTPLADIMADPNIDFWQNTDYRNCTEIYESGKSIGNGEYQILDDISGELTSTGCTF